MPRDVKQRCKLRGHKEVIRCIAWSPDGDLLATGSDDRTIRLWDARSGELLRVLEGHTFGIFYSLAWSLGGDLLTTGSRSDDRAIRLWDAQSGKLLHILDYEIMIDASWPTHTHVALSTHVAWSPGGDLLAAGYSNQVIQLWDAQKGRLRCILEGHTSGIQCIAWSPGGDLLAAGSGDRAIRLWDAQSGKLLRTLEGHIDVPTSVAFSYDGCLLASRSLDGTIYIWRTDTWDIVAMLEESSAPEENGRYRRSGGLAFHPKSSVLATFGEKGRAIHIWDLDIATLLETVATPSNHYANAKVVLVGETGVGKSGLGLVLAGQPFVPTDSSHGRHVWTFDSQEVRLNDGSKETRETILWDLAGQPGYRLIHQLHLSEVAVALIVFDARSETDPFAGVCYWDRALHQAQHVQGSYTLPLIKFLVAARVDRGGKSASRERVDALVQELGFNGYFETSAREGQNIAELIDAIKHAIDWTILPKVSSTALFQGIKTFLLTEKETGRLLSTADDLYRAFLISGNAPAESEELYAQFESCIGLIASRGLIRRLNFGNLVLLQPEVLDAYASALVNAVKDEPDGLGSISEEKVRVADFPISIDERLKEKEQEKLLLIAMIEDLLRHEIVLREQADDGSYLVFPSQSTRENPNLPDPEGKAVIYRFEGPVLNIYSTLAVRLSHSDLFKRKELWKNAVIYTTKFSGTYGMFLNNTGEGSGGLTLFFDKETSEETRFYFEEYVLAHLQRRVLPESIQRSRIFVCSECNTTMPESIIQSRIDHGYNWLSCPVCEKHLSLLDREERLVVGSRIVEMDRAADSQREREAAQLTLQGKITTGDFDLFLCHNGQDKPDVKRIGEELREQGILPWLDEWELRPGYPWQRLLEQQIEKIQSVAVFVGENGIGPWQQEELEAFLREFTERGCPVIPVLLPNALKEPKLPPFLRNRTWVDFRKQDPNPMKLLIWGITGKRIV